MFFFCIFRSPLSKTHLLEDTPTLIFIGLEDKRVLPESQGIPLYKAIRSQKLSPTSLYHYPKEGHSIKAIESIHHFLSKSVTWIHRHWRSFDGLCTIIPPTTTTTEDPTTTTMEDYDLTTTITEIIQPIKTTTKKPPNPSSAAAPSQDFYKATFVIVAMQFLTLNVWYQLQQNQLALI